LNAASRAGKVLFVAPIPPPIHGAALAMLFLMPLRDSAGLRHINTRFAGGVGDMGRLSMGKVLKLLRYSWQMVREVAGGEIGLVVLTPTFYLGPFFKDSIFVWLSSFLLQKKSVAWLHMDFSTMRYDSRPAWVRWFVRKTLLRCDRFVVVSDCLKHKLPAWIPADRVDAVPNGVEVPDQMPVRQRADGMVRVLYLSNLEPAKGWRVMVESARLLCQEFPHLEFVLHGKPAFGETTESIEADIVLDNAAGRISYRGPAYAGEKWRAYAEADIFCFPSFNEAFPLVILEAMAAGLPIVATNVGAITDALEDGAGGIVVPPQDASSLAAALRKLIADQKLRIRFGLFNRNRFKAQYTLDAYQRRWLTWLSLHNQN
jgi:glycosyltransferase involved in cell wall biosynthesis